MDSHKEGTIKGLENTHFTFSLLNSLSERAFLSKNGEKFCLKDLVTDDLWNDGGKVEFDVSGKKYEMEVTISQDGNRSVSFNKLESDLKKTTPKLYKGYSDEECLDALCGKSFDFRENKDGKRDFALSAEIQGKKVDFGGPDSRPLFTKHLDTLCKLISAYKDKDVVDKNFLLSLATGDGKTYVQALYLLAMYMSGQDVIFFIPDNLVKQFEEDVKGFLPKQVVEDVKILCNSGGTNEENQEALKTITEMRNEGAEERESRKPKILVVSHDKMLSPECSGHISHIAENTQMVFDEFHSLVDKENTKAYTAALTQKGNFLLLTATPDHDTYKNSKLVAVSSPKSRVKIKDNMPIHFFTFKTKSFFEKGKELLSSARRIVKGIKGVGFSPDKMFNQQFVNFLMKGESSPAFELCHTLPFAHVNKYKEHPTYDNKDGSVRQNIVFPNQEPVLIIADNKEEFINLFNHSVAHNQDLPVYANGNLQERKHLYKGFQMEDSDRLINEEYSRLQFENYLKFLKSKDIKTEVSIDLGNGTIEEAQFTDNPDENRRRKVSRGYVDLLLCKVTGKKKSDLEKAKFNDLNGLKVLFDERLKNHEGFKVEDFLYNASTNSLGVDKEGAEQIAEILNNYIDVYKSLPNDELKQAFVDNWRMDLRVDAMLNKSRSSDVFNNFVNEKGLLFIKSGIKKDGAIEEVTPFSGYDHSVVGIHNSDGTISKEASNRKLTTMEMLDPNSKQHIFTPKFCNFSEQTANNYMKMGLVDKLVSDRHIKGYNDTDLNTTCVIMSKDSDSPMEPNNFVQAAGRTRAQNVTNPVFIEYLGKCVKPIFNHNHLANKEDFYPELFKASDKYNKVIFKQIGENLGNNLVLLLKEHINIDGVVDNEEELVNKIFIAVSSCMEAVNKRNNYDIEKSKKDFESVLEKASTIVSNTISEMQSNNHISRSEKMLKFFLHFIAISVLKIRTYGMARATKHFIEEKSKKLEEIKQKIQEGGADADIALLREEEEKVSDTLLHLKIINNLPIEKFSNYQADISTSLPSITNPIYAAGSIFSGSGGRENFNMKMMNDALTELEKEGNDVTELDDAVKIFILKGIACAKEGAPMQEICCMAYNNLEEMPQDSPLYRMIDSIDGVSMISELYDEYLEICDEKSFTELEFQQISSNLNKFFYQANFKDKSIRVKDEDTSIDSKDKFIDAFIGSMGDTVDKYSDKKQQLLRNKMGEFFDSLGDDPFSVLDNLQEAREQVDLTLFKNSIISENERWILNDISNEVIKDLFNSPTSSDPELDNENDRDIVSDKLDEVIAKNNLNKDKLGMIKEICRNYIDQAMQSAMINRDELEELKNGAKTLGQEGGFSIEGKPEGVFLNTCFQDRLLTKVKDFVFNDKFVNVANGLFGQLSEDEVCRLITSYAEKSATIDDKAREEIKDASKNIVKFLEIISNKDERALREMCKIKSISNKGISCPFLDSMEYFVQLFYAVQENVLYRYGFDENMSPMTIFGNQGVGLKLDDSLNDNKYFKKSFDTSYSSMGETSIRFLRACDSINALEGIANNMSEISSRSDRNYLGGINMIIKTIVDGIKSGREGLGITPIKIGDTRERAALESSRKQASELGHAVGKATQINQQDVIDGVHSAISKAAEPYIMKVDNSSEVSDRDNEIDSEIDNEIDSEIDNEIDSEIDNEIDNENYNEIDNENYNEIDNKNYNEIDSKIDNEIDSKIDNEIDNENDITEGDITEGDISDNNINLQNVSGLLEESGFAENSVDVTNSGADLEITVNSNGANGGAMIDNGNGVVSAEGGASDNLQDSSKDEDKFVAQGDVPIDMEKIGQVLSDIQDRFKPLAINSDVLLQVVENFGDKNSNKLLVNNISGASNGNPDSKQDIIKKGISCVQDEDNKMNFSPSNTPKNNNTPTPPQPIIIH